MDEPPNSFSTACLARCLLLLYIHPNVSHIAADEGDPSSFEKLSCQYVFVFLVDFIFFFFSSHQLLPHILQRNQEVSPTAAAREKLRTPAGGSRRGGGSSNLALRQLMGWNSQSEPPPLVQGHRTRRRVPTQLIRWRHSLQNSHYPFTPPNPLALQATTPFFRGQGPLCLHSHCWIQFKKSG